MFGFRYIKAHPGQYLMQFRNGARVREGTGLAFWYYAPRSTLVGIPQTVADLPFMFEDVTGDFQAITLQGEVSYRIADPARLATQLDFTLLPNGTHASDDPDRLPLRVLNALKAQFRTRLQALDLRDVLQGTEHLASAVRSGLEAAPGLTALGVEIVDLGILAARPTPDTARALEAPVREQILKQADDATYTRRNAAIDQERIVRENELRSELAVEHRKRAVRESEIESERIVLEKRQQIARQDIVGKVALEQDTTELVKRQSANAREAADARAHGVRVIAEALQGLDARSLQALLLADAAPETLLAAGFQTMADNAARIGTFNFSPDWLQQLAGRPE